MSAVTPLAADPVVCRCLGVTESRIRDAVTHFDCESVREVSAVNEAGAGCTVCHCRIKQLIADIQRQRALAAFTGGGCGL